MELIPLPTECEKCAAPVLVTFTGTPECLEPRGATWCCPHCHAEHSIGVIGHVVSVRPQTDKNRR